MMSNKGIWFGKLADGTEASISDMVMQEVTVVQATRVRLLNRSEPLNFKATMAAAQQLRQRFPELNREETPTLYSEARFSRKSLPEEVAASAVKVDIPTEPAANPKACRAQVLARIQELVMHHPSSLSRLGWRVDVLWSREGEDVVAWIILPVSHTHADGVAMLTMTTHYLEAYLNQLQGNAFVSSERLPLYSALPRDRVPLSKSSQMIYGLVGWLASKFIGKPGSPEPKLITNAVRKQAKAIQQERMEGGRSQYEGPMQVEFVELSKESTKQLCDHARSVSLTVGALVHSALFVAIAKRYFHEHPDKKSLALELPMSVNMRRFLQPPLPDTVLAPQQGEILVQLKMTRREMDLALASSNTRMIPLVHKLATESRTQVQKSITKPEKLAPLDTNILLASLFRHGLGKMGTVQYIGDAWLSNVGLFRPTAALQKASELVKVESTLTLNPTIVPAYELVWCNSVAGGNMTLSMVTDETMGRDQISSRALLKETADLLKGLTV